MERLPAVYSQPISRNYFLAAVSVSLVCVGLIFRSPVALGLILGAVFIGIFFSSRTFRWVVFPAVLISNQFLMRNAGVPYLVEGLAIQSIDWIAILLILTVFFKRIFAGTGFRVQTGLEKPIRVFLGAIAISLFNAPDMKAGIINWGHTALYFITYYAMVIDWEGVPLQRIWRVYFFCAVLAALSALWPFLTSGGMRSLGLAGIPLNHLIIPLLCFELSRLSLGIKFGRWWVVALFVLTAIATQTRGVWLGGATLLAVWFFCGFFLKPFKPLLVRGFAYKVVGVVLLLFLLFDILAPLLGQAEQRAEQIVQHGGTVYLRLFLWGVALKYFVAHPVIGIGMGQFAGVMNQFPEMKNLAVFTWTHGLSAHNLLLAFLAETGVVGTCGFLFLLVSAVLFAWKGVHRARTLEEIGWGWGFFMIFTVFAISFLFAGTWEYHFVFFLALLVLFTQRVKAPLERNRAD